MLLKGSKQVGRCDLRAKSDMLTGKLAVSPLCTSLMFLTDWILKYLALISSLSLNLT